MQVNSARTASLDTFLCVAGTAALGATLVPEYLQVTTRDFVATDFKTLNASAILFAQHRDPYRFEGLATIFQRNGVVEPPTWFAHSPVYPPGTLLLLAPFTHLSMAHAAQLFAILSLCAYACALAMLLALARRIGLAWPWRTAIIGLALANPFLAYGVDVGNVSVLTASFCIAAWTLLRLQPDVGWSSGRAGWASGAGWSAAVLLGVALLLKPHLAIWTVLALLLFGATRARVFALAGAAIAAVFTLVSALLLAGQGILHATYASYFALLSGEQGSGSMSPASREVLPIMPQITAVRTLLGLYLGPVPRNVIAALVLFTLAGILLAAALRRRTASRSPAGDVLALSAMTSLGLIATYHRAHDTLILLPLLLWVAATLAAPGANAGANQIRGRIAPALMLVLYLLLWVPLPGYLFIMRQESLLLLVLAASLAGLMAFHKKKAA